LLNRITGDWLAARSATRQYSKTEEAAIRKSVMAAIGTIRSGDSTRAERASERVREIIYKKHVKESKANARRFRRRTD
jgi:hypothetical protein